MPSLTSNRLIGLILCLALFVRVLVPVGFMPAPSSVSPSWYTFRICTGSGPQTLIGWQQQPGDDRHEPAHPTVKTSAFCSFTGLQTAALPVFGLAVSLLLVWRQLRLQRPHDAAGFVSPPAAWPRGPPAAI